MSRRCFLVVGPESAGNRLTAAVLVAAGCAGDASTHQRWADTLPDGSDELAVVIRSFPHAGRWPNLWRITRDLKTTGYRVTALVTARHPFALYRSQTERGHHLDDAEAYNATRRAYAEIIRGLPTTEWYLVPYESLCESGGPEALCRLLELPVPRGIRTVGTGVRGIRSQNAKHYRMAS